MYLHLSVECPTFLSNFNQTLFSQWKGTIKKFTKIRSAGAELFHAGGQTDLMKIIVMFFNLACVPKS